MEEASTAVADLPPGFRFHPTDEEIVTYYLIQKVVDASFTATAIGEADLNKCEPWDLPQKAKMGEKEWYFFCQRDRKYPTGMRTNRATQSGYWKATGKDKEIFKGKACLAGMKKTLVFYRGRAPKGEKTNWVMHEFRLEGQYSHHLHLPKSAKDEWVVCRVFHKNVTTTTATRRAQASDFSSLPPLMDPTNHVQTGGGFDDGGVKWRPPGSSGYYLKYFSIGANDHHPHPHHHLHLHQPAKLPLPTPTNGTTTMMIPTSNPYPPVPEDSFFSFEDDEQARIRSSFEQLGSGAANGTTATECKMEQVSCSMMSGLTQEISSSMNNSYEAAAMADLDLWDY